MTIFYISYRLELRDILLMDLSVTFLFIIIIIIIIIIPAFHSSVGL